MIVTNFGSGALLQANTGSKTLAAGASMQFEFALLITPVKPIDPVLQFGDRYFHDGGNPAPAADWKDWHVNVINVHHANWVNPNINWPFTDPPTTTGFITNYQAQGAKVKLYYTVRELTQYPAEVWALRSLGHEILTGGGGGGFPWLREHFVSDYSEAWYSPLPTGIYDAAVTTSLNSRWYNYYVEGANWLAINDLVDGFYLDDVAYDRTTLKRIRRVLKQANPRSRIDLHSNTGFSLGPVNQYAEFLPFLDRLWFGESFDYNSLTPEQWLVQVSGIPFGPMGEMLQGGGNPWLGAVFGLTRRYGWNSGNADPRPVWRIWDQFGGLTNATMLGWWENNPPVTASDSNVRATAFVKEGKTLLALGNFSSSQKTVTLNVNWTALGLDSNSCSFFAPASSGFQAQALYQTTNAISIPAKSGLMFIIQPGNTNSAGPAPRLKAHYLMSETNGTTVLDELGAFHGTYAGNPVLGSTDVPASSSGSLRSVMFNGAQWAELPAALADQVFRPGGSWTVSFWLRPTLPSPAYNATFVWMDNPPAVQGVLLYLESNSSFDFWIGDGSTWNNWPNYNPGIGLQDRWYHVAAAYDGATVWCYLDGQLVKTAGISSFMYPAAGRPITVGLRPGASPSADLHGRMTDLRLYTGLLTAQDVQALSTYPGRNVPVDASDASYLTLASKWDKATSTLLLDIPGVASWQYQLERTSNLSANAAWEAVGPLVTVPPAGNQLAFSTSISSSNQDFFRLRITR